MYLCCYCTYINVLLMLTFELRYLAGVELGHFIFYIYDVSNSFVGLSQIKRRHEKVTAMHGTLECVKVAG